MPTRPRRIPRPLSALRTIRHRLALLLALPTLALVIIATFGTVTQASQYQGAGRTRDQIALVLGAQGLVHQLQRERGLTAGLLGGDQSFRTPLDAQRKDSDQARVTLDQQLAAADPSSGASIRASLARLDGLAALRGRADTGEAGRSEALTFFTGVVSALADAAFTDSGSTGSTDGTSLTDRQLTNDLHTLRTLADASEAAALERGTLNGVLATGSFHAGDYPSFVKLVATKENALAQVRRTATAAQTATLDAALRSQAATTVAGLEQQALPAYAAAHLSFKPADWWGPATTLVDDLYQLQVGIGQDARARAQQLRADALQSLLLEAGLALLALAGAVTLALVAARSIIRPLRSLSEEAHQLADETLPRAVERVRHAAAGEDPAELAQGFPGSALSGRSDEIAEVARALDGVAGTALRLAVEQTVLQRNSTESLANLGRRNQTLVSRQLGFLSTLERGEHDPGVLANLFELDHLATRMRRNAESILVLAGERSPRRWAQPVAMGDVLRSALGEVDDYQRVVLRHSDEALLDGGAVAEVAHLLAELLENALAASSPDTDVAVYARAYGADYLIAIVDHGHGLSDDELAAANLRLSGGENFLVGRTRLLGHYVVGRLAARLGARVRLAPSPMTGVTASVLLPGTLLAAPGTSGQRSGAGGARQSGALR